MRAGRPRVIASAVLTSALLALPAAASAEYTTPQLLSANGRLQADAFLGTVSGDGRSVIFRSQANRLSTGGPLSPEGQSWSGGGLYRRAVAGGEPELIVPSSVTDDLAPGLGGDLPNEPFATPSASADGRYVSFTTKARLVPQDANAVNDVYVRDMTLGYFEPGAFSLVSAADGSDDPLTYADDAELGLPGSLAGASAMSADGRRVAFVVLSASDLTGPGTLAGQVAVRDLDARTTTLVSRPLEGSHGVAGGAPSEAQLSGDGSTVTWFGTGVRDQLRISAEDLPSGPPLDIVTQLLWRRIDDGPQAPTRLVIGPVDPDDPACGRTPLTYAVAPGPCDGPIAAPTTEGSNAALPSVDHSAMSADGRTVFANAGPNRDAFAGTSQPISPAYSQLFAIDMTPGLTRKAAATPLGFLADQGLAATADGSQLIVAGREPSRFSLLARVGAFPLDPLVPTRVFAIDLARDTLELLSRGFADDAADGVSDRPAVSADGRTATFISVAKNLAYGDANAAADLFAVARVDRSDRPAPVLLPPAGAAPVVPIPWRIDTTASALRSGTVRLAVKVPAAGRLTASATAAPGPVRARPTKSLRVASAKAAPSAASTVRLVLRPGKAARRSARTRDGLRSTVALSFRSPAGRSLKARVTVTFRIRPKKSTR